MTPLILPLLIELAQKIALAAILLLAYLELRPRLRLGSIGDQILFGLVVGILATLEMLNPVHMAPGRIIDGRVAMLALVGFFGGPLSTAIAVIMAGICRS